MSEPTGRRHHYALIMAGGGGTRLWPASRPERPKQLMAVGPTNRTLLTQAAERAALVVGKGNVRVITAAHQAEGVRRDVPWLEPDHVMVEPVGRNTGPCIGLGAMLLKVDDPEAVMAVLPADHYIADDEGFAKAVSTALHQAESGQVVTLGIKPGYPATGYGYIETGDPVEGAAGVFWAQRFVEKPDRATAQKYLDAGTYLWNSGMFFMKTGRILDDIRRFLPDLSQTLVKLEQAAVRSRPAFDEQLQELYPKVEPISVDYGIMEKEERLQVVPASFGWNDVGSWASVAGLYDADENGNVSVGDNIFLDSKECLAYADDGRTIAVVGLEKLVVVSSGDALLVCPKDRAQQVREVVEAARALKKKRSK
jgi:mannose-1-phosphate guanylyltransferase